MCASISVGRQVVAAVVVALGVGCNTPNDTRRDTPPVLTCLNAGPDPCFSKAVHLIALLPHGLRVRMVEVQWDNTVIRARCVATGEPAEFAVSGDIIGVGCDAEQLHVIFAETERHLYRVEPHPDKVLTVLLDSVPYDLVAGKGTGSSGVVTVRSTLAEPARPTASRDVEACEALTSPLQHASVCH